MIAGLGFVPFQANMILQYDCNLQYDFLFKFIFSNIKIKVMCEFLTVQEGYTNIVCHKA